MHRLVQVAFGARNRNERWKEPGNPKTRSEQSSRIISSDIAFKSNRAILKTRSEQRGRIISHETRFGADALQTKIPSWGSAVRGFSCARFSSGGLEFQQRRRAQRRVFRQRREFQSAQRHEFQRQRRRVL